MARVTFVKAAQKDIYQKGKYVKYISEKGKRKGQELTKKDRTIPENENDTIFIAKGESYYWWQFMHGGRILSKTAPKRSQLTQSGFLSGLYELEDRISEMSCETKDDFDSEKEDILSEIESMKDQCHESLDNMPESLQSSPTGELLQERIDALDGWYSEIESIECEEYDEDNIREELRTDNPKEEDESEDDFMERIDQETADHILELVNDAVGQLQETSSGL